MKKTELDKGLLSRKLLLAIGLLLFFMGSAQTGYPQEYEVVTDLRDGVFEVGECTYDPGTGYWFVGVTLKLEWDPVPGAQRYYICNDGEELAEGEVWTGTEWVISSVYGSDQATSCEEAIENMKLECLQTYADEYSPAWSVKAVFDVGTPNPGCDWGYVLPYYGENTPRKEAHDNVLVSEPVDVITGEVRTEEEDISIPTRGLSLSFSRTYNSLVTDSSSLGPAWTHQYNMELYRYIIYSSESEELGRYAELRDGNGNYHRYQYIDGEYRYCSYSINSVPTFVLLDFAIYY